MAKLNYGVTPTSVILRVKLLNSSVTTGAGLTGLTSASAGLIISTIKIGEATATAYTVTGATIETITALGTYETPTATKCRFKEVDATNHPGLYEIHLADARFASTGSLIVSVSGATNLAQCDVEVQCSNLASNLTQILGTAVSAPATAGILDTNVKNIANAAVNTATAQIGANVVTQANIDFGALQKTSLNAATPASVQNISAQTGDSFGRLGAPAAASISADILAIDNFVDELESRLTALRAGYLDNLSGGAAALEGTLTQMKQKLLGTFDRETDSLEALRDRGDAAWITATGFATPTNITAGVITTVTNLTNAPGAGDFTAVMKVSLNAATPASIQNIPATGTGFTALGDARIANLDAAVSTRATPAQVNTEVVDVLTVDTIAEMAQGAPPTAPTMQQIINYLYRMWRNKVETTATVLKLYDDAGITVLTKTTLSDDATTFTKAEYITGL